MKFVPLFLLLTAVPAFALQAPRKKAPKPPKPLLARVTAYWTGEKGGRVSALGTRLRPGHCAVDPRRIPYGSKLRVGKEVLTAVDTGKDVRSRRAARSAGRTPDQRNAIVVDKFFPSRRAALAWVRSNPYFMQIQIL